MELENHSIQIKIPAEAEYIDVVRLTLYGIANKLGFSYEEIEDLKVAVSEACNNVVVHAYDEVDKGIIELFFYSDAKGLSIKIKDQGKSFKYQPHKDESSPLLDKELNDLTEGGLGLYLMQALVDEVHVNTDEGTEVVLMKYFNRSELTS